MTNVSIVMPVRNGRDFIAEAIASALAQGDAVSTVIVIDDGSSDGTQEIVSAIPDPRVRLVTDRPGRRGVSAARNDGAALAESDWLMFLDADDRLRPGAIEALLAASTPRTAAIYGDYDRIDASGRSIGRRGLMRKSRPKPQGHVLETLLAGNFIVNGGIMIVRRPAFAAIEGFDETLHYCEDWHAWCRLAAKDSFAYMPTHILDYRVYGQSVMMARPLTETEYGPALERLFSDPVLMTDIPPARRADLRHSAHAHLNAYAIGQAIRARRFGMAFEGLARTLRDDPRHFPRALMMSGVALAGL